MLRHPNQQKGMIMKKTGAILLLLLLCGGLFAYDGHMAGQKDLKVIKTEFFDIIYGPDSQQTAALLAAYGDAIYRELHQRYQLEHEFRLPVTIVSTQDSFNAHFTTLPYNHIVVFDTQPTTDIALFSNDILSVFRHELAHAITINNRNRFWSVASKIFGDVFTPYYFVPTGNQLEGVSILEESRHGEGRLNNEFARHFVKQAKIEGKFPSYPETTGARDIYLRDYQYKFGGEFAGYLYRTYGEEKYTEYWRRLVNLGGLTYFTIFKSVYGISMKEAWRDFEESIDVQPVPADPSESGNPDESSPVTAFEEKKKGNRQYTAIASDGSKLLFLSGRAVSVSHATDDAKSATGFTKPRQILSGSSLSTMSLSADGRYLTVVDLDSSGYHAHRSIKVYDFETKDTFTLPESRHTTGTVFWSKKDGRQEWYLAAVRNVSQNSSLQIFRLVQDKKDRIKEAILTEEIPQDFGVIISNLQADSDGNLLYLKKTAMNFSIECYNPATKSARSLPLPQGDIFPKDLAVATDSTGTVAYFSYVQPGTMPRLGKLAINRETGAAEFTLYQNDISGGFFSPAQVGEDELLFIGRFLEGDRIYAARPSSLTAGPAVAAGILPETGGNPSPEGEIGGSQNRSQNAPPVPDTAILHSAQDFSLWPYLLKGSWLPLSIAASHGPNADLDGMESFGTLVGATFVGTTPWERPVYLASVGYQPVTNSGIFNTLLTGGAPTGLFTYLLNSSLEVDGSGYKQTYHNLLLNSLLTVTPKARLMLLNTTELFEGRPTLQATHEGITFNSLLAAFLYNTDYIDVASQQLFFARNRASVSLFWTPTSRFGLFGVHFVSVGTTLDTLYTAPVTAISSPLNRYDNLGFSLSAMVVLLNLKATLYPSQSYFLQAEAMLPLFAKEIQWSPEWFPLIYINRIAASLSYTSKFSNGRNKSWSFMDMPAHFMKLGAGDMTYTDILSARLALGLTPNVGVFTPLRLNFDFNYSFFPEPEDRAFEFAIGLSTNLY